MRHSSKQFLDDTYWVCLIKRFAPRYDLPLKEDELNKGKTEMWLDRLNISHEQYYTWYRDTPKNFYRLNPQWTLRAWVGLLLEKLEE